MLLKFLAKALIREFEQKALTEVKHPRGQSLLTRLLSNTGFNYEAEVGDGTNSSVIMAPVQWIQRAFNEAPLQVVIQKDNESVVVDEHPMVALVNRPNPFYSEIALWRATILSYLVSGNAYWLKRRSAAGQVVELWWVPSNLIAPKWPEAQGNTTFISHYEYSPGGTPVRLDLDDVVHFRAGLDPLNLRLGLSPLRPAFREAWMDAEAGNFVAAILRNGGIPGVIISPKNDQALPMDAEVVKEYITNNFTGDKRGEPLALGAPTDVAQFGWSPEQLDLSSVRNVAEERVCALLGIAAAVVGFGSGLEQTKVGATMEALVTSSWNDGVIPVQRLFADEVDRSLLPDFTTEGSGQRTRFDTSDINALQDDLNDLYRRADIAVRGGWSTVAEGKRAVGLETTPADNVYLRGFGIVEVPNGQARPMTEEDKAWLIGSVKRQLLLEGKFTLEEALEEAEPVEAQVIIQDDKPGARAIDRRALAATDVVARSAEPEFEKDLLAWFNEMGDEVARAAGDVLDLKALEDEIDVEAILDATVIAKLQAQGLRVYDSNYTNIAKSTFGEMNAVFGLSTNLHDRAALKVLETSGRRLGLLDLEADVKSNLFTIIRDAREQGLGPDAIKRQIRDTVGSGPWSSPEIRARVVARTETKFAQNVSMVEYTKESGASQVLVFDARKGPTDAECEAINGALVSVAESEALAAEEHPNGTRSFVPWFEDSLED